MKPEPVYFCPFDRHRMVEHSTGLTCPECKTNARFDEHLHTFTAVKDRPYYTGGNAVKTFLERHAGEWFTLVVVMALALLALSLTGCSTIPLERKYTLNATLGSYHFDRNRGYNEKNLGLDLQYYWKPNTFVRAGWYKNSINNRSKMLFLGYEVRVDEMLSWSMMVGGLSGYDKKDPDRFQFAILPAVRIQRIWIWPLFPEVIGIGGVIAEW